MKKLLVTLMTLFLMASCATILNKPYKDVKVYTTRSSNIIYKNDTVQAINSKAFVRVARKNEPFIIVSLNDSITKTVEVKPITSFCWWLNIPCTYGLGMLVDKDNPVRYTYPGRIYINSTDTISEYYRFNPSGNKGELYLHLSLPHINSFHLIPENEKSKTNTGFWGITFGIDYYYFKNQYLNFGISGVSDFFVPFPAAVGIEGEYELMSSRYFSLSNNHRMSRFTFGYGISYANNTWDFRSYDRWNNLSQTREPIKRSHNSFGLIFPTYYRLGERFYLGIIYRPTFYRPNQTVKFAYEHLISVDFAWKIRILK